MSFWNSCVNSGQGKREADTQIIPLDPAAKELVKS